MDFNDHSNLKGTHALLSASKYHWLRYDDDKLVDYFKKARAREEGTRRHEFAEQAILLGQKLSGKTPLVSFVNDSIGFKMKPEVLLFYSRWCYGTADSIGFNTRKNLLRIFDLKNGESPVSMDQLLIYDGLFCLEYGVKPTDVLIENRIYRPGEIVVYEPEPEEIVTIMDRIVWSDKVIESSYEG